MVHRSEKGRFDQASLSAQETENIGIPGLFWAFSFLGKATGKLQPQDYQSA